MDDGAIVAIVAIVFGCLYGMVRMIVRGISGTGRETSAKAHPKTHRGVSRSCSIWPCVCRTGSKRWKSCSTRPNPSGGVTMSIHRNRFSDVLPKGWCGTR